MVREVETGKVYLVSEQRIPGFEAIIQGGTELDIDRDNVRYHLYTPGKKPFGLFSYEGGVLKSEGIPQVVDNVGKFIGRVDHGSRVVIETPISIEEFSQLDKLAQHTNEACKIYSNAVYSLSINALEVPA